MKLNSTTAPKEFDSYLSRYSLPDNGTSFPGHWYSFRVGSVFFISLDGSDVAYQDSGPAVSGPNPLSPAPATRNAPIPPGTSFYVRGYSKGEQTRFLERTLRKASEEEGVDWIVVQTHYGRAEFDKDRQWLGQRGSRRMAAVVRQIWR